MNNMIMIGPWISRFLVEHLINERNLAQNTQASYRDMLALLLPYASGVLHKPVDRLLVEELSPALIQRFLGYVQKERKCETATRNQRLAAIHSLARYIGAHSPQHLAWCTEIQAIPFKKAPESAVTYLEKHEMDAILNSPDQRTAQGIRDYTLLVFLYNTGARADETARLTISDLRLGRSSSVRLFGKGEKVRYCPLWKSTVNALNKIVTGRSSHEPVFRNRRHQRITRFGIYGIVKRHSAKAAKQTPSLVSKPVSPHIIRHTTAVHLLRAGVDINTIRAWLGHVSLDTTNVYAEVDFEMKAEALAHCEIEDKAPSKKWRNNINLMTFLKNLQTKEDNIIM